ncbi:MAG: P-type Ca2+ transporter type [Acidobacteriota bacterium]|nr:P-type Ca2+ transporter type [Acidobacteriota bacterium]
MNEWYKLEITEVLQRLGVRIEEGMNAEEAAHRLAKEGPNILVERGKRKAWRILWEQLTAVMVLILIFAAVFSGVLGAVKDTIAIATIVILFVLLGFIQEYRAEKAMAALKKLAVPMVKVYRSAQWQEISARNLVPGDLLQLETGNHIPADCRLVESVNLRIQEATLTGESVPVEKHSRALAGMDLPLGDRRNMAYMGTVVTFGRGKAIVTATGMNTELGKIANLLQEVGQEHTPLQQRLDHLGRTLAVAGIAIAVLIFVLGLLRGDNLTHLLLTGVSVAVAIVPEGLPAIVTITLALGAQRMLKRRALIRKLPAVETLGSVTIICSDKTGTLTENRMTVMILDVAGHEINFSEEFRHNSAKITKTNLLPAESPFPMLLVGGALCNDAQLVEEAAPGHFHTLGDPTEGALLVAAARMNYWKDHVDKALPRVAELPFDSERKRMTTVHRFQDTADLELPLERTDNYPYLAFSKGSVDGLLEISNWVFVDGRITPLTPGWRERIEKANQGLAQKGMRVLGTSFRLLEFLPYQGQSLSPQVESDLVFVGLFGMMDPPRSEVRTAVQTCRTAGIRPVMITGDHPLTALHIAGNIGITGTSRALTGLELQEMPAEVLEDAVEHVSVYARVSPEHKLKIVQALQSKGHIVAMTGDGVNDAPALKKADIGVAMGITGTDVAKEAADMVLLDDNFATIVAAVEEGRVIYDNIRKFVKYSVTGNIGKVMVMLLAPFLGKPLPLLPLQLLWLNLLTDGLMGLGLGLEPPEPDTMRRSPYSPQEKIFSRAAGKQVAWVGIFIGILALAVGAWYFYTGRDTWQTMIFTTLAFSQVWQALAARSAQPSSFIGIFSNPLLAGMVGLTFVLQVTVIYVPALGKVFQTVPLSVIDFVVSLVLSSLVFIAMEIEKRLRRRAR